MRIALIARGCRPGAGIERYTYELAKRLAGRHEVHLFSNPREVCDCGVVLKPIRAFALPHWHSIIVFSTRAGFEAQTGHYDVVHTQGSDGTWGDVVTAHSCHSAGMRASLRMNPSWSNQLRKWLSPAHRVIVGLERATFLSARHLVAVSRRVARQLKTAYRGTQQIPMDVIYPGVDLTAFASESLEPRRALLRAELGLPESAVLFVLLANAPRLKGAERLIQALGMTRNSNSHLLIATRGGLDAGLRRMIAKRQLQKRVHTFEPGSDALTAYAAADVQTGMPEYESFGLTLLEAMACGRPLLVTRNAGAVELMQDGREGLLLPWFASPELAAAGMDRLSADPRLRQSMGAAGRHLAQTYSWDRMVAALEPIYQRVADEKKR